MFQDATFITTTQEDSDGETVELHPDDLQHQQQHHIIPVQHAYIQQYGNQQIIKVRLETANHNLNQYS